jgi:oleandomycin transport system ATP-binding protein
LALFAVAGFRLLPSLQRIQASFALAKSGQPYGERCLTILSDLAHCDSRDFAVGTEPLELTQGIRFEQVSFRYENDSDRDALVDQNLFFPKGRTTALVGASGSGKTTAIRVLSTLLQPDGGRASVGGFDVVREPKKVRRIIGLTGQYAAVDELLSGKENLFMIGRLLGLSTPDARARATQLLGDFDLDDAANKLAKTYSGGMRRRLDLAASLVGRPRFLYLDEPTTGLDPRSRLELWTMIRGLVAEGTTVLLTTQYLDEADRLADEIVVIDHGRVIAAGTPKELKTRIGGQVLEAQPVDPADMAATVRVLAEFVDGQEEIHADGQIASVTIADRSALGQVARRLDDEGIVMDELSLRRPSLDEVFLAITGHVADEELDLDGDQERRSA